MGSFMNFKNVGNTVQTDGSGVKQSDNFPLVRQSSIYSLTFDEFQNTLGGSGKDFGSMNMEDLLKSIWTAEESQALTSSTGGGGGGAGDVPDGNLQRQGSLTLPRTLSQKTVDEVWRDVLKETIGVKNESGSGGSNLGPREPTLGEMTLEEFLAKAGVVREDTQPSGRPNVTGFYGGLPPSNGNNNSSFTIAFQQPQPRNRGVLESQQQDSVLLNSPNLGVNMSGVVTSSQQQFQPQSQPQPQPLFPKQTNVAFSSPIQLGSNGHLSSPVSKSPVVGMTSAMKTSIVPGGGVVMGGLNNGVVTVAGGSPGNHLYSDSIGKSNTDTSSVSPSPYNFGEGGRGRRSSASLEKVVERRRRRMIKNRESAARSRARKQAYTLELEAEVDTLRKLNEELRKKQEELVEMQKNQILETMNKPWGDKRRCLRRTLTGPW